MKFKRITTIIIALLLIACICLTVALIKSDDMTITGKSGNDRYISGILYQKSAEVAAQYAQAYELARIQLDRAIEANGGSGEGLYIVTDIDATLIDDSSYVAGAVLASGDSTWDGQDWSGYYSAIATEAMQPVPGAQEFISYAGSQGVKTFFITNRPYYELDLTVQQLYRFGFIDETIRTAYNGLDNLQDYIAYDDEAALSDFAAKVESDGKFEIGAGYFSLEDDYTIQVQGLDFSSDKAARRNNVERVIGEKGKVVLYLGDSFNDMISKTEYLYTDYSEDDSASLGGEQGSISRKQAVSDDPWKDKWGTEFIVMPNSAYGDWIAATWFKQDLDDAEKTQAIKDQLEAYSYLNYDTWYEGPSPTGSEIK